MNEPDPRSEPGSSTSPTVPPAITVALNALALAIARRNAEWSAYPAELEVGDVILNGRGLKMAAFRMVLADELSKILPALFAAC